MSRTSTPPRTLEYVLLGMVRQQPMHGYEIYQRVKTHDIFGAIWRIKQGQVYALLAKLEQAGYLAAMVGTHGAYPPRKVWHLTPAGATAFTTWMSTPVQRWQDIQPDLVVRLFFAQLTGDDIALTLVERQRTVCSTWLADLTSQLATLNVCQSSHWLVNQFQKHQIGVLLDWLSDCTRYFREPLYVVHTIAPLCDAPHPTLANRFVDYVCSPAGQSVLESYRFLPVYTQPAATPILPVFRPDEMEFSPNETLTVYTAATLMEAFRDLARTFSELHGGMTIDLVVAGSQYLADQLLAGESADVFASANPQPLQVVCQAGRIRAGSERPFARNRLIAVTSETCSVRLNTLRDLAQPGIKIALGSQAAAIGHYTQAMLTQATRGGYLETAEHDAVLHNVSFYEQDVRLVLSRVLCGEADVGIVYSSDYYGVAGAVKTSQVYPLDELWLNMG